MASKRPRVIGLTDLLRLEKPLRERPAPVVYFSDAEFKRLTKGATVIKKRPSPAVSLPVFDPWPGGGMVQSRCDSPEGQTCVGQWRPGPGGGGVYFQCICRPTRGRPPIEPASCTLQIDKTSGAFTCVGTCRFGTCGLGLYQDPATGQVVVGCRCVR